MKARGTSQKKIILEVAITNFTIQKENDNWLESLNETEKRLNIIYKNIAKNQTKSIHTSLNDLIQQIESTQKSLKSLIRQIVFRAEIFSQFPNNQKISKSDALYIDHISIKNEYNSIMNTANGLINRYFKTY